MELKIEYLPVKALKPYEKNARKHADADVSAIISSIKEFGFDDPIGIWGDDNIIVEGHGRLIAAKRLGMTEVPVIRLDHLSDEQRRAYALAHNKTAELSEWEVDILENELEAIADIDMEQFGFEISKEQITEKPEEILNETTLPESRIYIFAASIFGVKSECFADLILPEEEADNILKKINDAKPEAVIQAIRRALNDL